MNRVLIAGSERPTQREADLLNGQVGHLWYYQRLWDDLEIILGDHYGADALLAEFCTCHKLPHVVYGITVAPRNSASRKHYQRVVTTTRSKCDRRLERDLYMLNACDWVIAFGNSNRSQFMQGFAATSGKLPKRHDSFYFPPEWEPLLCKTIKERA